MDTLTLFGRSSFGRSSHGTTVRLVPGELPAPGKLAIVYQNFKYGLAELRLDSTDKMPTRFIVNVGAQETEFQPVPDSDGRMFASPVEDDSYLFRFVFGITHIILEVVFSDGTKAVYSSGRLVVALTGPATSHAKALGRMLDFIRSQDTKVLNREGVSGIAGSAGGQRPDLDLRASLLGEIIAALSRNLPLFFQSPKTESVTDFRIGPFEQLHTVTPRNLLYIATHPEELRETVSGQGMAIRGRHFLPERTLVSTGRMSRDTRENRIILSFIYTLLAQVSEYKKSLGTRSVVSLPTEDLLTGYKFSTEIIGFQSLAVISAFESAVNRLQELFRQYLEIFQCDFVLINRVPNPTPYLLEVRHYREIYERMTKWFGGRGGHAIETALTDFLSLPSADQLYEYYCLLKIRQVLKERFGFTEDVSRRAYCGYEDVDDNGFRSANTFFFEKPGTSLTLYYEPAIYSYDSPTRNGITLFRVDDGGTRRYYRPDFLLKKTEGGITTYAVLDAKWSRNDKIRQMFIPRDGKQNVLKYLYGIMDETTLSRVSGLWLLQGIYEGREYTPAFDGEIAKTNEALRTGAGIAELSPDSGDRVLEKVLGTFFGNGNLRQTGTDAYVGWPTGVVNRLKT